jgi:hypothetical protein
MPLRKAPGLANARTLLVAWMTLASCTGGDLGDGGQADGGDVDDGGQVDGGGPSDGGDVDGGGPSDGGDVDGGPWTDLHACGAPGDGEAMNFLGEGGEALYLVRLLVGQGVGNSGIYEPVVFAYDDGGADGDIVCVTALSAQSYANTHHNHYDVYTATSENTRYEFAWGFAQVGAEWRNSYTLTRFDAVTDAPMGEPIEFTWASGN